MSNKNIRVGVSISLDGEFSLQGKNSIKGIKKWRDWVNKNGGVEVNGEKHPIDLIVYNDESKEEKTKRYTEKLIDQDNVDILLGPYSSSLTLTASKIAEKKNTVIWNHGGASDKIYNKGYEWIIGVLSPSSSYFKGFLDMIKSLEISPSTIGILSKDTGTFSPMVARGIKEHSKTIGFNIKEKKWTPPLENPNKIVELIIESSDIIIGIGSFKEDIKLAKTIVDMGKIKVKAIALVAAGVDEFNKKIGTKGDGFFGPSQWEYIENLNPDFGPTPKKIKSIFRASLPIDYTTAQGFATGLIIQNCLEKLDISPNKKKNIQYRLRDKARKLNTTTFYGKFKIDPKTGKQIGHSPFTVQWKKNKKHTVWPKRFQTKKPEYPFIYNN